MNPDRPDGQTQSDFGVQTGSGTRVDVLQPNVRTIRIGDIARGLASEFRFPATGLRYSVASHSVVTARLVAEWMLLNAEAPIAKLPTRHHERLILILNRWQTLDERLCAHRAALFHDASEYVLRDLPRDVKRAMREFDGGPSDYDVLETRLMDSIYQLVRVPVPLTEDLAYIVKAADDEALSAEVDVLWPKHMRARFQTAPPTEFALRLVEEARVYDPAERAGDEFRKEVLQSAFSSWGEVTRLFPHVWPE